MYRKNCEKCGRPSYSSCEYGEWKCPTCGHDLANHPFYHASTMEKASINPLKRKDLYKQLRPYEVYGGNDKKTVQQYI